MGAVIVNQDLQENIVKKSLVLMIVMVMELAKIIHVFVKKISSVLIAV